MRPTLSILKRFLLGVLRNRANFGFMIVLPIVFTLVYGIVPNMSSNQVLVDVVNLDDSAVGNAVVQQINATSGYTADVVTKTQAQADLRNLKATLVITLPKGLQSQVVAGKPLTVEWQASPNAGDGGTISALASLQGKMNQWSMAGSVAVQEARAKSLSGQGSAAVDQGQGKLANAFIQGMSQGSAIKNVVTTKGVYISQGQVERQTLGSNQQMIIGFSTMFIIFAVFGSTGSIYLEKTRGTWNRLKASPALRWQILAGLGLGFFLVGWFQFLIMDLAGLVFFGRGVPMNLWSVLIVSLYDLAIVGIALCIASVAKSQEQHMITGSFLAVATSMLGGAYWPIDLEPSWMQKIAWFVPQSWAMDGFKVTALGLTSMSSAAVPLLVLAAFAVIFFGAGILQLRYS